MQKTAELLGVNTKELSEKCSKYSSVFIKQCTSTGMNREELIAHIKENFTLEDLLYMSLIWLNEKTDITFREILNDYSNKKKDEGSNS